ncbi:hypothetical protein EDB81DRAFT_224653 [Dactylonectria macrodidyma]|uniref:Protein kinase domain-containing protein n=1 Tax=Dactylonectria macrodidyma TaxID=307937 RepID=A0A9P9IJX9_9HYPO|nr:hypothetical protein EDB81DRAFT_224653 [Dactylonectria macrodidyma]
MATIYEDEGSAPPAWSVIEFTCSLTDTDSTLIVTCNSRRVVINIFADNFSSTPALKEKYVFFLDNFDSDIDAEEDFYDWVGEPMLPIFRQLGSLEPIPRSLDVFLSPETYYYTLRADGDSLVAIPRPETKPTSPMFGISIPEDTCSSWPSFKPSDIRLCEDDRIHGPPNPTPAKVMLGDETIAFLKLMRRGDKGFLLNELGTYKQIHNAHLDENLRISRLLGTVRDEQGRVVGLLLTYIDCRRKTLACAAKPSTEDSLRQKWSRQIESSICELHSAGIAWGDAKPDNVLIDQQDDAWLIDFGGSYRAGWVPKELAGTRQGDLVALAKIREFLRV